MFKAKAHLLVTLGSLLILAGCQTQGTGPTDPPPPASPTLTLSPASININAGGAAVIFSALVQNSSESVTWTLSGPGSVTPMSGSSTTYTPSEDVDSAMGASLTATLGTTGATVTAPIAIYPASVTPPEEPPPSPPSNPPPPTDPPPTDPPPTDPPPTDPPPGETDTTPPTVASIEPPIGATGVAKDADIVITFGEKMDQSATQAAYQSADLPAGAVTFDWNAGSTVLTLRPNIPLEYAAGTDPSLPAKRYRFSVTSTAKDTAGNPLAPVSSDFSTLKQIDVSLTSQAGLDGNVTSSQLARADIASILVGDLPPSTGIRSFLSFDLSSLPEGVTEEALVQAELSVYKVDVSNSPYAALNNCEATDPTLCATAQMELNHVNYGDTLDGIDFDTARLADLGGIDSELSPISAYRTADVLSAVRDDLGNREARGSRSQYRLSFPKQTNADKYPDLVAFTAGESTSNQPLLKLSYLTP